MIHEKIREKKIQTAVNVGTKNCKTLFLFTLWHQKLTLHENLTIRNDWWEQLNKVKWVRREKKPSTAETFSTKKYQSTQYQSQTISIPANCENLSVLSKRLFIVMFLAFIWLIPLKRKISFIKRMVHWTAKCKHIIFYTKCILAWLKDPHPFASQKIQN